MLSKNAEDYLKALYHLQFEQELGAVSGRIFATHLEVSSASVSGMLKKLKAKQLVEQEKYGKLTLSEKGHAAALVLIRKHRLWETFLHDHLNFSWDEVHEVAEQLEHIQSKKLIQELERFMDYPSHDPHGDPIPDANGGIPALERQLLSTVAEKSTCRLRAVNDASIESLKLATTLGLSLDDEIYVKSHGTDGSFTLLVKDKETEVTKVFAENVFVEVVS